MNARSFSSIMLLALAVMVSGRLTAQIKVEARSFVPSSAPAGSGDPQALIDLEKDLGTLYGQIVPERSLLIYDCGKGSAWCGDNEYSFAAIFTKAAAVAGIPADSAASDWYEAASNEGTFEASVAPWSGTAVPKDNRFQMLAIVNRMDLATWSPTDSQWTGAEVRFVYGLRPQKETLQPGDQFTVILEFILAPRDWAGFQRLAQKWMDLSKTTSQEFLTGLQAALTESGIEQATEVRMRTNRSIAATKWEMSQYEFLPQKGFAPATLTDQIGRKYITAPPGSAYYEKYINLWKPFTPSSTVESLRVGSAMFDLPNKIYTQQSLSMPDGACNQFSGPEFARTRNILALQQCTLCHTQETGTNFAHIQNRLPNGSSQLSKFLVGNNAHPTIRQLWFADPAAVAHVTVPYEVEEGTTGKPCPPTPATPVDRYFHDLGRRALFLAAVLSYQDQSPDHVNFIKMLKANFSH